MATKEALVDLNGANGKTPKKRLTLVERLGSVSELVSTALPPVEWCIQDIWTEGSRGFIFGSPGAGKTWIALDAAISFATGVPLFGQFEVPHPRPALIVEEESSQGNLQRRFHALMTGHGFLPNELTGLYYLVRAFLKISHPGTVYELINIIKDKGIKFVVFDSFRRFHDGDENSSKELIPVLEGFGRIQEDTGAAVVLIHHLNKPNQEKRNLFDRLRGSSDLWAWRDVLWGIEAEEGETDAKTMLQLRDAESPKPFIIQREINQETGGAILKYQSLSGSASFVEIIQGIEVELKGDPVTSKRALVLRMKGYRKQDIYQALTVMEMEGRIQLNEGYLCLLK